MAMQRVQGRVPRGLINSAMILKCSDSMPDAAYPSHDVHEVICDLFWGTWVARMNK